MKNVLFLILLGFGCVVSAQQIPSHKVISTSELSSYLKDDVKKELKDKSEEGLAEYFRVKYSERYFYDYKNFESRFAEYNKIYPQKKKSHIERAKDHLAKYADSTNWKLPFNYQFGDPVNAYALRHLARQHKMVDIAYYYFYEDKNPEYINYFVNQQQSLNNALHIKKYEKIKDGNGVYEAFRSGYRVLNWLQIHNMFLSQETYTNEAQLQTIATLLQHGAHLFKNNQEFHPGNHQTRGLSALAMISIILRDFEGTDAWYKKSMELLAEHLKREINEDGFQFERSVHYHMSDIGNFYYVYALAKKSNLEVEPFWEQKLKSLFTTLTKIAYPDKSAPVLQDDTDEPWAEKNIISGSVTLGYLLFGDPEMGYFANTNVEAKMFWYVNQTQLKELQNITSKQPKVKSVAFPSTHYYITREGWKESDKVMIITAGVDKDKPDHQHGDILGVQAMANGKTVLPNYQVRYSLKDLELFKNSMVKNVALVDNELLGKQYTSNQGGSGFGKFKQLPKPEVLVWETSNNVDVFVGKHNGFENVGVAYSRQVIYIKDDFWIVKDNFSSEENHTFKQVWQGHYTLENKPNIIRSTFDNGSGFDIYQLEKVSNVEMDGARGKQWAVVSKNEEKEFSFITVLFPYASYSKRINETIENPSIGNWTQLSSSEMFKGENAVVLNNQNKYVAFSVSEISIGEFNEKFDTPIDVFVDYTEKKIKIQFLSEQPVIIKNLVVKPGGVLIVDF